MRRLLLAAAICILPVAAWAQVVNGPPGVPASSISYIYPRDYGAKCDGRTLADVTTTASSATITSTGYQFTSADIGKSITVGAGANLATTANTATGSNVISAVASLTGVLVGDYVFGAGIPANTRVMVIGTTTLTLTANATANATGTAVTIAHIVNTTVSSVNAGAATLVATLQTSITGTAVATFGSDDQAALNLATTAAAASSAGGGTVLLPTGMCIVSQTVLVPSKVSVFGVGSDQTLVKWLSTGDMTGGVFSNSNAFNAATCTLANAQSQSSNNRISGFAVDAAAGTLTSYQVFAKGVSFPCSYNVQIDHMLVTDTPATGIATDWAFGSINTDNIVINAGRLGATAFGSNGIGQGLLNAGGDSYIIANNVIINPAHFGVFVESQTAGTTPVSSVSITGNVVRAGPNSQLSQGAVAAGIGNSGSNGAVISGNHIIGYGTYSVGFHWDGITVDGGTLGQGAGAATSITGNTVENTYEGIAISYIISAPQTGVTARSTISGNTVTGAQDFGIRVVPFASGAALDAINIVGNTVSGSFSGGIGIVGAGAATNISIANNMLNNNGATTVTDYRQAGISIGTNTTNLDIVGNRAFDNGTGTQKYGLAINTGVTISGSIQGNDFTGNATSALLNHGTITGWVVNNKGYNPIGASSVSPTGSPMTYTAGATPETLYISGGTVSAIVKNSVTLASATGFQVQLDPGEAVVVTYSVAPTMTKDQH